MKRNRVKNVTKIIFIITITILLMACSNPDTKTNYLVQNQEATSDIMQDNKKNEVNSESTDKVLTDESKNGVDVDLTELSSTMVYSEVYNMMYVPEDYIGKSVKMKGMFVIYTNQDESQVYPAVIIRDATACCAQGIEFVLAGNPNYPEGYPEIETDITIMGTFETYEEDGSTYCRLKDAKIL